MKVILLKAVPKLGKAEDVVEVSEGFARNSLFPQKKAIPATSSAVLELDRKKQNRTTEKAVQQTLLDKAIKEIEGAAIGYKAPANDKGVLFSKITAKDVAQFLLDTSRIAIDPKCIQIPGEAIKQLGKYTITVKDNSYEASFIFTVEIK